jgi:hypothetical protein
VIREQNLPLARRKRAPKRVLTEDGDSPTMIDNDIMIRIAQQLHSSALCIKIINRKARPTPGTPVEGK